MAKVELEIIIDENGEVLVDVKGMKGKKCEEISNYIEEALGEIKSKKKKPEYYEEEVKISSSVKTEI